MGKKRKRNFYSYKCLSSGKENSFAKPVVFVTSPLFELFSIGLGRTANGPLPTSPIIPLVCLLAGETQRHGRY